MLLKSGGKKRVTLSCRCCRTLTFKTLLFWPFNQTRDVACTGLVDDLPLMESPQRITVCLHETISQMKWEYCHQTDTSQASEDDLIWENTIWFIGFVPVQTYGRVIASALASGFNGNNADVWVVMPYKKKRRKRERKTSGVVSPCCTAAVGAFVMSADQYQALTPCLMCAFNFVCLWFPGSRKLQLPRPSGMSNSKSIHVSSSTLSGRNMLKVKSLNSY